MIRQDCEVLPFSALFLQIFMRCFGKCDKKCVEAFLKTDMSKSREAAILDIYHDEKYNERSKNAGYKYRNIPKSS